MLDNLFRGNYNSVFFDEIRTMLIKARIFVFQLSDLPKIKTYIRFHKKFKYYETRNTLSNFK